MSIFHTNLILLHIYFYGIIFIFYLFLLFLIILSTTQYLKSLILIWIISQCRIFNYRLKYDSDMFLTGYTLCVFFPLCLLLMNSVFRFTFTLSILLLQNIPEAWLPQSATINLKLFSSQCVCVMARLSQQFVLHVLQSLH